VLACYWVYQHVGKHLKRTGSANSAYSQWIETYGGVEFDDAVQKVLAMVNELEAQMTAEQQATFEQHFFMTCRFEYMFWAGAWDRDSWPL